MTGAIYLEISEKAESTHKAQRRVSVSGMLKYLGVSRSGYHAWKKRVPSNTAKRREAVKANIKDIYNESKQNYGAPKITKQLREAGEIISERTVGKYRFFNVPGTLNSIQVFFNDQCSNMGSVQEKNTILPR